MGDRPTFRRRNFYINKKFQTDFSIKFLAIIVIEAILAIGLFIFISKGTLTTGYVGTELKVSRTYDFFLPMLLLSNIVIVGITGIIGIIVLILMSHRIAGPIFRFEKVLSEIKKGDLTSRFRLRQKDQFKELEESLNELTKTMDDRVGDFKANTADIIKTFKELQALESSVNPDDKNTERLLQEMSKKLLALQEASNYFKTSKDQGIQKH